MRKTVYGGNKENKQAQAQEKHMPQKSADKIPRLKICPVKRSFLWKQSKKTGRGGCFSKCPVFK